jgi:Cu(I)/Ag(I) efflux system membrane fusion protein
MKKKLNNNKITCWEYPFQTGDKWLSGRLLWMFLWLAVCVALSSCTLNEKKHNHATTESNTKEIYTCPMHPQIIRDKPGKCPICGMELVQKVQSPASGATTTANEPLGLKTVVRPVNESVIASVKVVQPVLKELPLTLEAQGYIIYDPRKEFTVSARYAGRIDRLYVKTPFQRVAKGEKLMDIYSPDILTAQQELIYLLNNDATAGSLITAATKRLSLLGLTTAQINQIKQTRNAFYLLSVYSPFAGHLHDLGHRLSGDPGRKSDEGSGEISEGATPMSQETKVGEIKIKEGMYVEKGEPVFNIVNTEMVWAILKIYPQDIPKVKVNQPVFIAVTGQENTPIQGKIDFIEPYYEANGSTANIRVFLPNHHHQLKIGNLLTAKIAANTTESLWVPRESVFDLGKTKIVWLKRNNSYIASAVQTGTITDSMVEITKGLTQQDQLAANAQYLVDSESFIKLTSNE